jgi:hypothetical protein
LRGHRGNDLLGVLAPDGPDLPVPDSNTAGDHLQLLREGIEALPLGADLMRKGPGGDQLEAWLKGMRGFPRRAAPIP